MGRRMKFSGPALLTPQLGEDSHGHSCPFLCPPVAASAQGLGARRESGTFRWEGRVASPISALGCPFLGNTVLGVPLDQHRGVLPPLKTQDLQKRTGKAESVTRERVSSVLRMYFPLGLGKSLVSPSMSSKQVSQLSLISATDTRQILLYIFQ